MITATSLFVAAILGIAGVARANDNPTPPSHMGRPVLGESIYTQSPRPLVSVAHRGGAGVAPEQTAAAYAKSVKVHPTCFEADVQLTSDGVPILVHDRTFARTTNVETVFPDRAHDKVGTFTYKEVRKLDAGSWFGKKYAGQRIPALSDILDYVYPHDIGLFLELKNPDLSPGLEKTVAHQMAVDSRWQGMVATGRLTFLSFDAASLRRMSVLRPEVPLLWLNPTVPSTAELKKLDGWADKFGTDYRNLDTAGLKRVRSTNLTLATYTVDTTEGMDWSLKHGVDTIISDYPATLLERAKTETLPVMTTKRVLPPGTDGPRAASAQK